MPDREKVIKEYEDYVNSYISLTTSDDYEFEMHKAVLALLKEQPQIVRCKDCRWYDEKISFCDNCHLPREQTFFCGDGKRREINAAD